jgi:hypothetical protein
MSHDIKIDWIRLPKGTYKVRYVSLKRFFELAEESLSNHGGLVLSEARQYYERCEDYSPTVDDCITDLEIAIEEAEECELDSSEPASEDFEWQAYLRLQHLKNALKKFIENKDEILIQDAFYYGYFCRELEYLLDMRRMPKLVGITRFATIVLIELNLISKIRGRTIKIGKPLSIPTSRATLLRLTHKHVWRQADALRDIRTRLAR